MPAKSKAQQKLMGADLARARAGKGTRTGMSKAKLEEYASTKRKGLPARFDVEVPLAFMRHRLKLSQTRTAVRERPMLDPIGGSDA